MAIQTFRDVPLLATALVFATGCVVVGDNLRTERVEKRFTVSETPELTLGTFDGSIEVRAWDRAEVVVEIEKRARLEEDLSRIEIASDQSGNKVWVEARLPENARGVVGWNRAIGARLVASVPKRTNLLVRTGDGSVHAVGVDGRIELRTGDGSVTATDLRGRVRVHTGDGSIRVSDMKAALDLETGDGSISVSGAVAALKARTGDGSVNISADSGSTVGDEWDIHTGDGGVHVRVPASFNADVELRTGDGTIRADRIEGQISKREVRGRLGSGGKPIRVRTGDGSITFRVGD
jgi:DUF4097 and DUF4098 domain-containing protein YvlB